MPEPASAPPTLSQESVHDSTEQVLREGRGAKPAVVVIRQGGRRAVVKDFSAAPWAIRQTYGRWLVGRECRIYRRLADTPGVPAFRGRLGPFAFAVDYVEGRTLKDTERADLRPEVFERLDQVFDAIHRRGVVHLDSHQKTNILLASDGQVYLLDFATALYLGTGALGQRLLVPLFGRPDRWGVLKLKARYCPNALTTAERRRLTWGERLAWLWPPQWVRALAKRWRRARRQRAERQAGS